MHERNFQFGSIATNVMLPWLLLILIVSGLTGYRYYQTQQLAELESHGHLHRRASLLASDLRFLAQARWSDALAYHATHDREFVERFQQRDAETLEKIEELSHLFDGDDLHAHNPANNDAALLDSYVTVRAGHIALYQSFLTASETGDLERQASLIPLLVDKIRLMRAALDDLTSYHTKNEMRFEAVQVAQERQANTLFVGLLSALILVGGIFSWFQTQSIVRPISELTKAAKIIGAGGKADLARFSGRGEIGDMSEALSAMVLALRRSRQEVMDQKDQLALAYAEVEDKVKTRTAELSRRTAELETANKDLEGFSYSVSHDLRAPLRAIDGFIAILQEDYAAQLDAEGRRLFGIVSDNARKMGHLIDDILAFSRAGRLELDHLPVNMNALVNEVWDNLAEQRGDRPIDFHHTELPTVAGDPRALRQVWQNLLSNAIKFTRDRQPARIEVSVEQCDDLVWFSVKDNGAGFKQDYQDKLFGLFQRLHGMDEFEGTGVGLAIVKRFVQKHGGQVLAEGEVGSGATFRFGLPAHPDQPLS